MNLKVQKNMKNKVMKYQKGENTIEKKKKNKRDEQNKRDIRNATRSSF